MPDKMIDLQKYGFLVEPRYYFYGWSKSPKVVARPSLVKALVQARKLLPAGYNFKIWDAYRSYAVQAHIIDSFRRRLKLLYPRESPAAREKILFTFSARLVRTVSRLNSHRTGGAFDLTIVDASGEELYMGTDLDELTPRAATNYFELKKKLTALDKIAKRNRRLLIHTMTQSGFHNEAAEWWHWSFGK